MGKISKFLLAILISILTIFTLSSCKKKEVETFVSGDFVCYYSKKYSEDKSVGIVIKELSDEGKQKEVIVIPEYIDGYRVYIYERKKANLVGVYYFNGLHSSNLKKIYIMHKINQCHLSAFSGKVLTMFMDNFIITYAGGKDIYIPYNDRFCYVKYSNGSEKHHILNANVTYYVDNEIYWIDDYDYGLISYIPDEPKKEGKTFVGWYTSNEYIRKWDFEHDVVPEYRSVYESIINDYDEKISIEKHICTELYAKFE